MSTIFFALDRSGWHYRDEFLSTVMQYTKIVFQHSVRCENFREKNSLEMIVFKTMDRGDIFYCKLRCVEIFEKLVNLNMKIRII